MNSQVSLPFVAGISIGAALLGYLVGVRQPRLSKLRRSALLLGDSITQYGFAEKEPSLQTPAFPKVSGAGWVGLVADHFSRKIDFINRGLSGYNTRKVCAVLDRVLEETSNGQLFATLFLGANDSVPEDDSALCSHVPLDEYECNLRRIVCALKTKAERIVIIAPPPVCINGSAVKGRTNEVTARYAAAAQRVSTAEGILFVDTFNEMSRQADLSSLLVDGVHLSAVGNCLVASLVIKVLEAEPLLASQSLARDLPRWRELDRFHPKLSSLKLA